MKNRAIFLFTFVLLLITSPTLLTQSFVLAQVNNPASSEKNKQTVRIMSYNVHHCNPPSKPGQIDIEAVAQCIAAQKPDLVALQEIDVHTGRSGPINQAEELGKRTGLKAYFFKAIDHDGGAYGIAILSRLPVKESKSYPLPTIAETNGEPRIVATVTVTLPGAQEILFACTHMDAQKKDTNRIAQIKEINKVLGKSTIPVVLAGDLNDIPESPTIRLLDELFERSCQNCAPTVPVDTPIRTIDFVAFYPKGTFTVHQHQVIAEKYASDHLPVVVDLAFSARNKGKE